MNPSNAQAPNPQPLNSQRRLHLDFGFDQQNPAANLGRAFPTTPSTFPQPVFPNPAGQREVWGNQQSNFGNAGYFINNPYPSQYQPQSPLQSPPLPGYRSPLSPGGYNDGTNGLSHQFAHQNLGGAPQRINGQYTRHPPPAQRPRNAGTQGTQQYSSPLGPQAAYQTQKPVSNESKPERDSEKYSESVYKRAKVSTGLVNAFFRESVQNAKDRNKRRVLAMELDQILRSTTMSDRQKALTQRDLKRGELEFLRFRRTKETPANYSTIKIIGKGAFGEVKLVQKKSDSRIYALKSLVKAEMFKKDQLAHVRSERDILAESDSPWVVKLYTTFQDNTFLYMLMEFLPGGDLMTMLIKYEIFSEDITRFYMAEIVLAIEAVHKLGFIHRDIKPDNILLDKDGHVKLTDFGLSTGFHKEHDAVYYQQLMDSSRPQKTRENRQSVALDQIQLTVSNRSQVNSWRKSRRQLAYSTVGTPDYIAPEIFTGEGYDFACDWWSVGTIMFECLVGWAPFCAEDSRETYRKIMNWQHTLHFPEEIELHPNAEDFIRRLVCNVDARMGRSLGAHGSHEIKGHPFFRGVDFHNLRRINAPFKPKLQSNIDTTNFPIDEIDQHDNSAAMRAATDAQGDEHSAELSLPFIGYTYKRFDAFKTH